MQNNDFHFDKERNNIIHENISGLQMIMPSHDNTLDDFSSEKDISDTINSIKEQKMSVLIVFKNLTNIDLTTFNIEFHKKPSIIIIKIIILVLKMRILISMRKI